MITEVQQQVKYFLRQAVAKHKEGNTEEAIDLYLKSLEIEKVLPDWVYENIIILLAQSGLASQALDLKENALKIHTNSDKVYRAIGLAFNQQDDAQNSINCYIKSLEINQNQPDWLYSSLIEMLVNNEEPEKAVKIGEKAIKFYGENPWIYYHLGEAYAALNQWEISLSLYNKAAQIQPELSNNIKDKIIIATENRLEKQNKINSESSKVLGLSKTEIVKPLQVSQTKQWLKYAILARDKAKLGENNEAIKLYEQAIALNPNEAWPYLKLAQLVDRKKQLGLYEKAIIVEKKNLWGYIGIVPLLKEENRIEEAIEKCEEGLIIDPDNKNLQMLRQSIMIKEGRLSKTLILEIAKDLFDYDFYKQQCTSKQDVQLLTKEDAFEHFLEQIPNSEGILASPTLWFFPEIYRDIHSDDETILASNPFLHYLANGYFQERAPLFGIESIATKTIINRIRPFFDSQYYLSNNPDLNPTKILLIEHFALFGWKEGRNPSPWFNLPAYQSKFPIVQDLDINPLYFYACLHSGDPRKLSFKIAIQNHIKTDKALKIRPRHKVLSDPKSAVEFKSLLEQKGYLQQERYSQNLPKAKATRLRIHFVIPEFSKGGGGHMTIFRIVKWLEFFGHECTVWVQDPDLSKHPTGWRDDVYRYFQQVKASFRPLNNHFWYTTGDILVATAWETGQTVMSHEGFNDRFYLVQDYEPYFFARGSTALRAEDTYRQDIACICASLWLKKLMEDKFGRWARHFNLAYESDVYKVYEDNNPNPLLESDEDSTYHLIVYSRKHTARRAVELCLEALDELALRRDDFIVHFFGDEEVITDISYQAFHHGIVDKHELADLYNNGTIGVTFSATNYSLVPQEMMACGLPIVEIDNESTVSIFPPDVVSMARPNPKTIANNIEALMNDPSRREQQKDAALEWISELSWESSVRAVEQAFLDHLREIGRLEELIKPSSVQINEKYPYHSAVMIPTFNGGKLFTEVLERVRKQHTPWPFQIVIVDSSSNDGTQEYLNQQQDIVFHTIPQKQFQHGATRNLGVKLSNAEYVAFLTQDALPAGDYWLYDLASCLEAHPSAAGVFGRHICYEAATEFTKRDLLQHFAGFDQFPVELSLQTDFAKLRKGDKGWQQVLHFYSDNNSCLRRSVWEKHPYPEVAYGEDQLWADIIIKAGYSKVYSKAALVYHSHDYNYQETFKRAKTEAEFFFACFGYKMVANRKQMEIDLAAINQRDIEYGKEKDLSMKEITHQLSLNRAKFEGWVSQ